MQDFRFVVHFVQEFRAGGPGFESDPKITRNGEFERQDMQGVVQRILQNPVGRLLYCYSQIVLSD